MALHPIANQVSILPFDVMGLVMESDAVRQFRLLRVVRLLRLLKLARILRASRIFRRWENQINMSYSFMSLIKFMVGVSTISHWVRVPTPGVGLRMRQTAALVH